MTENPLTVFFLLLVGHAIADFGLQSDWMAQNKRPSKFDPIKRHIVRFNHSLIHGGAVFLVLGPVYGIAETVFHFLIDSVTTEDWERPSFVVDQSAHVLCKVMYVYMWMYLCAMVGVK